MMAEEHKEETTPVADEALEATKAKQENVAATRQGSTRGAETESHEAPPSRDPAYTREGDKKETPGGQGYFAKEDPAVLRQIELSNADGPQERETSVQRFVVVAPIMHDGERIEPFDDDGNPTEVTASDFGGEKNFASLIEAGAVVPKEDVGEGQEVWVNYVPVDNRPAADFNSPGNAGVRLATLENFPEVRRGEDQSERPTEAAPAGPDAPHAHIHNPAKAGDTRAAKTSKK